MTDHVSLSPAMAPLPARNFVTAASGSFESAYAYSNSFTKVPETGTALEVGSDS